MVKEELIEGLRLAVSKGEPLEHAMATFYNSGYKQEDIEEAAASINQPLSPQAYAAIQQAQTVPKQNPQPTQGSLTQQPIKPLVQQIPQVVQRVSNYGTPAKKPKSSSTVITIVLVVFLVLLLGVLAALIIFKNQISSLLGGFWRALF
ncbi:MAG: hypothetical protein ABSG05_01125 [Candidatus Pacearchaeota archaeon]|jgi:hypothetical protein